METKKLKVGNLWLPIDVLKLIFDKSISDYVLSEDKTQYILSIIGNVEIKNNSSIKGDDPVLIGSNLLYACTDNMDHIKMILGGE